MSDLGKEIIQGLNEALDYADGDKRGTKTHKILMPDVDVAEIRTSQGLTQDEFCRRYHLSLSSLRNWEQGRRQNIPQATRLLLKLIEKEPEVVSRVLEELADQ